jgi:exonuclease SbcD
LADVAPVVMVVGNHDRQKGGEGRKHSIDVMRGLKAKNQIYVSDSIETIHFDHSHIITLPWTYNKSPEDIYDSIDVCLSSVTDDLPCILLSHAALEGAQYNENYIADLSVEEVLPLWLFCNECFDYVALGHIHKHQEMCPNVVYAGSLERVDWGEKDNPKGFILADVGRSTQWRFVDVHPRPMIEIETDWDDLDAIQDIDVTDAIVKISIKSKKAVGYQMAVSEVERLLDGYWLLDSLQVIYNGEHERRQAWGETVHLEALGVSGLLKKYFANRYPNDKKKVKYLLEAANNVIKMVDEERV